MKARCFMNIRVRGIVVENNQLLLIKRVRMENNKENIYYVFPGGGLEAGETLEEGVKREVLEELGIDVEVQDMRYLENFKHTDTYFFNCKWISGNLGTGKGPEFTSKEYENRGLYIPMAVPISELSELNVVPLEVRDLVINDYKNKEKGDSGCIKSR